MATKGIQICSRTILAFHKSLFSALNRSRISARCMVGILKGGSSGRAADVTSHDEMTNTSQTKKKCPATWRDTLKLPGATTHKLQGPCQGAPMDLLQISNHCYSCQGYGHFCLTGVPCWAFRWWNLETKGGGAP